MKQLYFFYFLIFCCQISFAQSNNAHLFPIEENEKWGFIDVKGTVIITPTFERVRNFSEGYAAVQLGGFWGFIDKKGDWLVLPNYDFVSDFKDGIALVWNNNGKNMVDKNGKELLPPKYGKWNFASEATKDRIIAIVGDDRYTLINQNGKALLDSTYIAIAICGDSMFFVQADTARFFLHEGKKISIPYVTEGLFDWNGKAIIPFNKYEGLSENSKEFVEFKTTLDLQKNQYHGYMNRKGKEIFRTKNDKFSDFIYGRVEEEYLYVNIYPRFIIQHYFGKSVYENNKNNHNLLDSLVRTIDMTAQTYVDLMEVIKDHDEKKKEHSIEAKMNVEGKIFYEKHKALTYYYDNGEQKITQPHYLKIQEKMDFKDTYSRNWSLCGFVKTKKEEELWYRISEGLVRDSVTKMVVHFGNDWYALIDSSGKVFSQLRYFGKYEWPNNFDENFCFVNDWNRRKWWVWNLKKDVVSKFEFDDFDRTDGYKNGLIWVEKNHRKMYLNEDGLPIWKQKKAKKKDKITKFNTLTKQKSNFYVKNRHLSREFKKLHNIDKTEGCNFIEDTVFIEIDTNMMQQNYSKHTNYLAYIYNTTKDSIEINIQDNHLYLNVQALDKMGIWRDIDYMTHSRCGNSFYSLTLPSNEYWQVDIPIYDGGFKTQLRLKWRTGDKIIYSKPYNGGINPAQFWNTKTSDEDRWIDFSQEYKH